jgi:hypothetical protein
MPGPTGHGSPWKTQAVVARTVRVTLRETGQPAAPGHVIDVVVDEAIRTGAEHGSAE